MQPPQYVVGQRHVSATEPELGLGIVEHAEHRRITIVFPAADERRTYAPDNAPLSRVRFTAGDTVSVGDGHRVTVTDLQDRDGLITYEGHDEEGRTARFPEAHLDASMRLSSARDRLLAGQIDSNNLYELRADALELRAAHRASPAFGLLGPRIELLSHQLYIAAEVSGRALPRVLLADEVGLGKTIEAGLVVHRLLRTAHAKRVLVVVPDSLVHQWLIEMLRRFNLNFMVLDEERCQALATSTTPNPFEAAELVICALSLLTQSAPRMHEALAAGWDVLVVDEAHHLTWTPEAPGADYTTVAELAAAVPAVLLLTATPEQLGAAGHFARLRLLDPARYHDLDAFMAEEKNYRPLNELVAKLQALAEPAGKRRTTRTTAGRATLSLTAVGAAAAAAPEPSAVGPELLAAVTDYLGETAAERLRGATEPAALSGAVAACIQDLLDLHGTGRVLFRNTRATVGGFAGRRLHAQPLAAPAAYLEQLDGAGLEARLLPELLLGENWTQSDPRVAWLVTFLSAEPDRKVLVLCALDETARALEACLRLRHGLRSAVFHSGTTLIARDRAAAYFAEAQDGAQVLVCSEIGSEGRNFQFAHDLVLLDLPLSPDLLEQRIGRLDRIGQRRTVEVHVPHYADTPGAVLLRVHAQGLGAFEGPNDLAERVLQSLEAPLHLCLRATPDPAAVDALIAQAAAELATRKAAAQAGRDRLLELNACRPAVADAVVDALVEVERSDQLAAFMERALDHLGVDQQANGLRSVILQPSDHMLHHGVPGLPEDGMTATFSRTQALSREDLHFLTWEHPLVEGAMDLIIDTGAGNTALVTAARLGVAAGAMLLECRFELHCPAPRRLQVGRFLPHTSLRVVVDERGRDVSEILTQAVLAERIKTVPAQTSHALIRHLHGRLVATLRHAQRCALSRAEPSLQAARTAAMEELGAAALRLQALAAVNPSVAPEEHAAVRDRAQALDTALAEVDVRLDAVRVIVAT